VQELLGLVQLSDLGNRYPRQLSGGQQQRVALARALAVEPRVLLLDEPFGALDAKVRKDLRRWLRELHNRIGRTTVFVTHDQEEALELADRVAILNLGKVEQVGKPDEVYDDPATAFVMSFVGDTTSIPVESDGVQLWHDGYAIDGTFGATHEGRCRLYLRPRDIAISALMPEQLPGKIVNIHRTAAGRRAAIAVGNAKNLIEAEIDIAAKLTCGEQVGLTFAKGKVFPE
jgi:sulfate transport system ATP-binding protein